MDVDTVWIDMDTDVPSTPQVSIPIPCKDELLPKTLQEFVNNKALFAEMRAVYPQWSFSFGFLELYSPFRQEIAKHAADARKWQHVTASPFASKAFEIRRLADSAAKRPEEYPDGILAGNVVYFYDKCIVGVARSDWGPYTGSISQLCMHYEYCFENDQLENFVTALDNWRDGDYAIMSRDGNQASIAVVTTNEPDRHGLQRRKSAKTQDLAILRRKYDDLAAQLRRRDEEFEAHTRRHMEVEATHERNRVQQDNHVRNLKAGNHELFRVQEDQRQKIATVSQQAQMNAENAARYQQEANRLSKALAIAEGQLAKTRGRAGLFDSESLFNPREVTQHFENLAAQVRTFVMKIVPNPNPAANPNAKVIGKITAWMEQMVGKKLDAGAEPVKKNALTACVTAVVGEIVYNALVMPIEGDPCHVFRHAATMLGLFPDKDDDPHDICEQRFHQVVYKHLDPASHPISTPAAGIVEPFHVLRDSTVLALKYILSASSFKLDKSVRDEAHFEIDAIADAAVSLRCRARAAGMTFWLDVPRAPAIERTYYFKFLDPSRVAMLQNAPKGRWPAPVFDETRMTTKSRTKAYAFAVFPGLIREGKIAHKEDVWCD
ncbi:hypothetical protein HDU86_002916 [Geranomyces michiganensis]|nr:hypothetical protein HDU86_002916 [Geranomyces michiganensis]